MYLPAVQPFKLELRWLQAQAFRWSEPKQDGWYYGVVRDSLIKVRQRGDGIEFHGDVSEESLAPSVTNYFRLGQDITPIQDALRAVDATMARLVGEYDGMRILRQDPWECLISYICSRRTRVDNTPSMINKLARPYGRQLTLDDVTLHAFPPPERLATAGEAERKEWKLGLGRECLIHEVATDIAAGDLDLSSLPRLSHEEAGSRLMEYKGIGWKIADCVRLFSLDKQRAFPIDANIRDALKTHYGRKATSGGKNARALAWVAEHFGPNAGYAGQLLFLDQLGTA